MTRRNFLGVLVSGLVLGITALPAHAKSTTCVWCSGSGSCQTCGGNGGWPKNCRSCHGTGQCTACHGHGHI